MCDKTRKDRIRNANIHDTVRIVPIEDKLRENKLMWFEHICRRSTDVVIRRNDMILVSYNTRGR